MGILVTAALAIAGVTAVEGQALRIGGPAPEIAGGPWIKDNDFALWKRYGVRAWPTALLLDRKGIVRYRHIGEGAYEETEHMIQRLLAEGG
jgi:hypothetical protein